MKHFPTIFLVFALVFMFALAAGFGCSSSKESADMPADKPAADSTAQAPPKDPKPPGTTVAQNGSNVEAVVENVTDLGGSQFNLKIFIVTSTAISGRTNIIEGGQRIIVTPQYYVD